MKRTNKLLWLLLLVQVVPVLLVAASTSGFLDPLTQRIVQSIPLPAPGERVGFLINATRFLTAYWFFGCIWLTTLGAFAAILYVAFDRTFTKAQRLVWAISFFLGQSVTVATYCVLQLLGSRNKHSPSVT